MNEFNLNIKIETERLILKYVTLEDYPSFFKYLSNDYSVQEFYVMRHQDTPNELILSDILERFICNEMYYLGIYKKDTMEFMGIVHQCSKDSTLFPTSEIGYSIGKPFRNNGYMTEAVSAFCKFLLNNGVHKIACSCISTNIASKKVMEKVGMTFEGVRVHDLYYNGEYRDLLYYYILNK